SVWHLASFRHRPHHQHLSQRTAHVVDVVRARVVGGVPIVPGDVGVDYRHLLGGQVVRDLDRYRLVRHDARPAAMLPVDEVAFQVESNVVVGQDELVVENDLGQEVHLRRAQAPVVLHFAEPLARHLRRQCHGGRLFRGCHVLSFYDLRTVTLYSLKIDKPGGRRSPFSFMYSLMCFTATRFWKKSRSPVSRTKSMNTASSAICAFMSSSM